MRTKPQTKARRNKRWAPQSLSASTPKTLPILGLELPEDALVEAQTDPERPLVNSGPRYESTLTRELKISANDVPVPPGGLIHDYDGLELSINRLNTTFINVRNRLEWAGSIIRSQEIALWEKECAIARLQGQEPPLRPQPIPYFEPHTDPGTVIMVQKAVVNRALMGLIGVVAGGFGLACVWYLLFR